MNKKTLTALLAFASALCLCRGIAACAPDGADEHTHHFEYVYNNDATCTEDGTETERCECGARGETRVKEGSKLGHDMQEVQAGEATCTEDGVIYHWHCNRCGLNFEDEDGEIQLDNVIVEQKLGHEMVQIPAKNATCSECGYPAHTGCSRCGYTEENITYTDALHVEYILLEGHCSVIGLDGKCTDSEIKIPSVYKGHPVTSIGDYAFQYCSSLESIIIPESVTSIGDYAFLYCSSLESVTIPKSVISIDSFAFVECSSLTSVTFEEESNLTSIGEDAFAGCSLLTSIIIPNSVTSIGEAAFYGCSSLESITIPASVTEIGRGAFERTAYYENNANWINDILYIGDYLISARDTISGVCNIREGTKLIADNAFTFCSSLESIVIPEGVIEIGLGAFLNCSSLESIAIPESVTSIGSSAFQGCSSLESIAIPESVIEIGGGAFAYCSSLESITIPDGVTSIGDDVFYGTAYSENSANWINDILYVGDYLISASNTISGVYNIKEGTKLIAGGAFYGCKSLTSITIPASVTLIGEYAFSGCDSLESIDVATGNQNYSSQDGILYDKGKTKILHVPIAIKGSVTIPESVTEIGRYAFAHCSSLTRITIPANVASIGYRAFRECSSLGSITFEGGSKLTSIGDGAFENCGSLTSVTIPASMVSIGNEAFGDCYKLVEVWNYSQLPIEKGKDSYGYVAYYAIRVYKNDEPSKQTVTDDGFFFYEDGEERYLFGYKGNETSLTLPTTSPSGKDYAINQYAFRGGAFTSVIIPEGVTSIGEAAFYYCSSLTSINIPESVTSIGEAAFFGCPSLESIIIPESVTSIGEAAFFGCRSLESIIIPESVTSIGEAAFRECNSLGKVFYGGTKTDWGKIDGAHALYYRSDIYYFSSTAPSKEQWAESPNWWHYDEETGEAVEWKKN